MVDWAPLLKYSENEVRCRCGASFLSHTKGVRLGTRYMHVSRKPCPGCKSATGAVRIRTEPESWSIG